MMNFANHEEYVDYEDGELFERFWYEDSTPYLAEQSAVKNRKLIDGARQRYEAWKQKWAR